MKIRRSFTLSEEADAALLKMAKSGLKLSTIIERLILNKHVVVKK
jgi:hypothetical protein